MITTRKKRLTSMLIRVALFVAATTFASHSLAKPTIIQPAADSTFSGTAQTFNWTADGSDVDRWWFYAGTSPGASDIANSGNLGTSMRYRVFGLPVDGSPVYVRLWHYGESGWRYTDSSFLTAQVDSVTPPTMTSPMANSELSGGSAVFKWADNNTSVNYWWLYVGTRQGSRNIYNSGAALRGRTSVEVNELPTDGSPVYVRLWYRTAADGWSFVDNTFTTSEGGDTTGGDDNGGDDNGGDDNGGDDDGGDGDHGGNGDKSLTESENLALIMANATRNTQFDDNAFRNVPMDEIDISDLTLDYDAYNEGLLDTTNSGYFRVKCEVSHFAYDDPIVFPGEPGKAHLHMFFGNTQTNAYSTFNSLLNTGTGTCNGEDLNRTAYWVPAMLDSAGDALIPDQVMVYYKNDNFRLNGANELVEPFPDNLRMISGKGSSTSPQTDYSGDWNVQPIISFSCGPAYRSNDRRQALIPDCSGSGNQLEMQIVFPQCVNLDIGTYSSDQSHTSFSENGYYGAACPESHPTDISSIMYRIFFRPDQYGGSLTNLHLSSDVKMDRILPGGTTAHADWFGAWHPGAMDMWIENCNNTQADCETGLLGRNPAISLVPRKRNFYESGYKAPARELVKLCPGKEYDPADPLRSVANCRMH